MGVADLPGQPAVFKPNKWPISPKYARVDYGQHLGDAFFQGICKFPQSVSDIFDRKQLLRGNIAMFHVFPVQVHNVAAVDLHPIQLTAMPLERDVVQLLVLDIIGTLLYNVPRLPPDGLRMSTRQ
jgi:hypothetical protein